MINGPYKAQVVNDNHYLIASSQSSERAYSNLTSRRICMSATRQLQRHPSIYKLLIYVMNIFLQDFNKKKDFS